MTVGDKLRIRPTFSSEYALEDGKGPWPCVVVYIHPEQRFYVVEFRSALGIPWRETFYFAARRCRTCSDWSSPVLPEERGQRI